MPLPRSVALFNRKVTNRVLGRLAPYAPGFGVVHHVGRKSQRPYSTPVNVFRQKYGYIIALTYGADADWTRNVLAAGGCELTTRGKSHRLTKPRLFHDKARGAMPPHVRFVLGLTHVYDFLELRDA